jgi:predicted XRE-type DNA-binding protein
VAILEVAEYKELFKKVGYDSESSSALLLRIQLLKAVKKELEVKNWTQAIAAKKLGVKQPRISEIYALRIDRFSAELLVKYLYRLGKEVRIKLVNISN